MVKHQVLGQSTYTTEHSYLTKLSTMLTKLFLTAKAQFTHRALVEEDETDRRSL
jgi:hypothetical protein